MRFQLLVILWLGLATASAQPCLIQGDPGQPTLDTFAGTVQPKLTAAEPAARVTVVIFPGGIAEQDRHRTALEVAGMRRAAKGLAVETVLFRDGGLAALPAPANPAMLQKSIEDALASEPGGATLGPPEVYGRLGEALGGLGGQWSSVLFVGLPPEIASELREYAVAWLTSRSCASKLRLSYWTPDGQHPELWNGVAAATAGSSHLESLAEFPASLTAGPFWEASWPAAPLRQGFLLEQGKYGAARMPLLEGAPGFSAPPPARYAMLRRAARDFAALVTERNSPGQPQRAGELLAEALAINPADEETLRAAAEHYAGLHDYQAAARMLGDLTQVRPRETRLYARSGHYLFLAGDITTAEPVLLRAHTEGPGDATVAEELGRIRIARKDDSGALPFLDEALRAAPGRADLWFLRADTASRLKDWVREVESLEKGLAIDKSPLDRRTSLIRLYLEHGAGARALSHVQSVIAALPADAAILREYAGFLDALGRGEEALTLWKKAVAADPKAELAHFRVARLLLDRGAAAESLTAADAGLSIAPASARLRLVRAEALDLQGRHYDARDGLRVAAASGHDPELLARLAEMEDVSGRAAARAYLAAVDARPAGGPDAAMLERGLEVALRDGDAQSAAEFRARLVKAGKGGVAAWLTEKPEASSALATVPGGLKALAFIAHSSAKSPRLFLAEYCRTLVARTSSNPKVNAAYLESIKEYFQLLASLKAMGTPKGDRVEVEIAVGDKKALQKSTKILELLGWRLRNRKEGIELESGEKLSQARRQEVASALGIDEIAVQEAVKAGRPFQFQIESGSAPVVLTEARWLTTFFPKEEIAGGLAEAFARDVRIAKVYAALSAMAPRAAAALVPGADLKMLVEKHSELIYSHASAFALRGARAAVPGGDAAVAVWEKLVGAPVANPGRFFRALIEKDEGKLLAFFDLLGQLDIRRQRFLTLNANRAARFYELFGNSPDMERGAQRQALSSSFVEFLREIPLDDELHVLFPGSPEVWMLAKGKSSSASQAVKMAKKLSRITAPEQEDEILIRIAQTRYSGVREKLTECDNFVAVVRIDRHRTKPLDEASALLLAQHFAYAGAVYPYFATLTELAEPQFERFFRLVDQLRDLPGQQLNTVLAQLHSLIEILCLGREAGSISGKDAAELFGSLCERFAKASAAADYAAASLDSVRELISRGAAKDAAGADAAMERILLGSGAAAAWQSNGETRAIDADRRRNARRKVLAAQKTPSLETLLELDRLWRALAEGRGAAQEHLKAIEALQPGLPDVPVDKKIHLQEADRKVLSEYDAGRVPALVARLKQRLSRKKVNLEDIRKLRADFLAALSPYVHVALSGIVYAQFLSPEDLLVAEDPLLVRKHRYLDFGSSRRLFPPSGFQQHSEGAGSYLSGGFAAFPVAAGQVAVAGSKNAAGSDMAATQIGALRATRWDSLQEVDLRLLSVRLRLAREWVLHAAADESAHGALEEETLGLLSPTRRAQLLESIAIRDWESAFQATTPSDLYALSERYFERFPKDAWQSPVTVAARKLGAGSSEERLRSLGGSAVELMGCSHSHLAPLGPYEYYERLLFPYKLAERATEFKLFLAETAGRAGVPPAALATVAEPLAMELLSKTQLTDIRDWRSMLGAFASLDEHLLESALEGAK